MILLKIRVHIDLYISVQLIDGDRRDVLVVAAAVAASIIIWECEYIQIYLYIYKYNAHIISCLRDFLFSINYNFIYVHFFLYCN